MSKTRKQYDREFKVMAVELSKGRSDLSILSKELEIRQQAVLLIFEYIEIWYNRKRLHSALGYVSPKDFEKQLNKQIIAA